MCLPATPSDSTGQVGAAGVNSAYWERCDHSRLSSLNTCSCDQTSTAVRTCAYGLQHQMYSMRLEQRTQACDTAHVRCRQPAQSR